MISSLLGRRLLFNPARFQNLLRGRVRAGTRIVPIVHAFVLHLRISFNPLRIKHKRPALLQPLFPFRRYPRFPPLEHIRQLLNLPLSNPLRDGIRRRRIEQRFFHPKVQSKFIVRHVYRIGV